MITTYSYDGTERQTLRVRWEGKARGFYVQRHNAEYLVSGHLSHRGGWTNVYKADRFETAQDAADAAKKTGVRRFHILENNY